MDDIDVVDTHRRIHGSVHSMLVSELIIINRCMKLNEIAKGAKALKTQKGSPIKRSKFGVGKLIGGYLYLHRNYVNDLPNDMQHKVAEAEQALDGFKYNVVKIGMNTNVVAFINSRDFDTAPEPTVGDYILVDLDRDTEKEGKSGAIWHHKWLWVKDDYKGFDVDESYERSEKYLKMDIDFSRIGNKKFWEDNYAKRI